jgi:hypothetical protein
MLLITGTIAVLVLCSACGMIEQINSDSSPTPAPTTAPELTSTPVYHGQLPALREEFQPDLRKLGDLPFYRLSLALDPAEASYQGTLNLELINLEGTALDSLYFRLFPNGGRSYGGGKLEITRVTSQAQIIGDISLALDDSVLKVEFDKPLQSGELAHLVLEFAGDIPRDFEGGGYGIFNATKNTVTLSGWYPILAVYDEEGWNLDPVSGIGDSVYSDMALYEVVVSVPAGWDVIGTGIRADSRDSKSPGSTQRFISGPARDFLVIAGTAYESVTGQFQDVTVTSYFLPGHQAGGERALQVTGESLEIFHQDFGPYPYRELDVVEIPMRYAAGVEFPGVSLLSENIYDSPRSSWFATVAAHEAAHQWWYNLVGSDVIDEPWLDEALTTYSSLLYFEELYGEAAYLQMLSYYRDSYQSAVQRNNDHPVVEDLGYFESSQSRQQAYSPIVYSKGAVFFHELRELIGTEAFFLALQEYYTLNQYEIGTPEELLGSFENSAGRDLDNFYQEWLYSAQGE